MVNINHGYEWRVSSDPSGDFAGRRLRLIDIQPYAPRANPPCPFEEGTVFVNERTGEKLIVRGGQIFRKDSLA